jgi:hypothetical protein
MQEILLEGIKFWISPAYCGSAYHMMSQMGAEVIKLKVQNEWIIRGITTAN